MAKEIAKDPETPKELAEHAWYFADAVAFDEVFFQFILCEISKVINFMVHGDVRYMRTYWGV